MSFAKIKSQTLPDMVNSFSQGFDIFKSSFENNLSSDQKLLQNIRTFDFQIQQMESKLNDAPDNKKDEYSHFFQTVLSEYLQFKHKYKNEIDKCFNEQNLRSNNYQEMNNNQNFLIEQSMEEQEAQNLEYIARESEKIVRQMKEINEISNQVFNELNSQRPKIVSIESITDKSVKSMEKGNEQLEKAEKKTENLQYMLICLSQSLLYLNKIILSLVVYFV